MPLCWPLFRLPASQNNALSLSNNGRPNQSAHSHSVFMGPLQYIFARFTLCYRQSRSQKPISSPWCFSHFLSLCSSSVKSCYVFSRPVKVCRGRGSPAHYGLSRMVLRFIPACYVLLGSLIFLLHLSSSVKVFYDKTWAMNGV